MSGVGPYRSSVRNEGCADAEEGGCLEIGRPPLHLLGSGGFKTLLDQPTQPGPSAGRQTLVDRVGSGESPSPGGLVRVGPKDTEGVGSNGASPNLASQIEILSPRPLLKAVDLVS